MKLEVESITRIKAERCEFVHLKKIIW